VAPIAQMRHVGLACRVAPDSPDCNGFACFEGLPSPARAKYLPSTRFDIAETPVGARGAHQGSSSSGYEPHEDIPLDSDDSPEFVACAGHVRSEVPSVRSPQPAMDSTMVVSYLSAYGFPAVDADMWQMESSLPNVLLRVVAHDEIDGHTHYLLVCEVSPFQKCNGLEHSWGAKKRLQELRSSLHDSVKQALGDEAYRIHFGATPFARRGGPRGTTARLNSWLQALKVCVSKRSLRPRLVADLLLWFDAPRLSNGVPVALFS